MRAVVVCWVASVLGFGHARADVIASTVLGTVRDARTREPIADVSIAVTSDRGTRFTVITDTRGGFVLAGLGEGHYHLVLRDRAGHRQTRELLIDTPLAETLAIELDRTLDLSAAATRFDIDQDFLDKLPRGHTYDTSIGGVPGAQSDLEGVAYSGSTSLENRYTIDGIDVTGLRYGNLDTALANDLVREVGVTLGGTDASRATSTGALVDVAVPSGSNEFHGSLFGYLSPDWLVAAAKTTPPPPGTVQTIDVTSNLAYDGTLGFELSGPIVKDHAWFFIGTAPESTQVDQIRQVRRLTDCHTILPDGLVSPCESQYADGKPDIDPQTGQYITDLIETTNRPEIFQSVPVVARVDVAPNATQQGAITAIVIPTHTSDPGTQGAESTGYRSDVLTADVGARWTARLTDRVRIDAGISWHHASNNDGSFDPAYDATPQTGVFGSDLGSLATAGGESQAVKNGCATGGPTDPYPLIIDCPVGSYAIGGPGTISDETDDRVAGRVAVTTSFDAFGAHELQIGADLERDTMTLSTFYSGGYYETAFSSTNASLNEETVDRYVQLAPLGTPGFDHLCSTPNPDPSSGPATLNYACSYITDAAEAAETFASIYAGGFAVDRWRPLPNVLIEAGARLEYQLLRDTGISLSDGEPRIGVVWDPGDTGRTKLFAHWGRYDERVPMDVNADFGHKNAIEQLDYEGATALTTTLGTVIPPLIAPNLRPEYLDELVAGAEYEVAPGFRLSATLRDRRLGEVIEDVGAAGAPYVIGNPGEWSSADDAAFERRIANTADPSVRADLQNDLSELRWLRLYDKPVRDYDALELVADRRFGTRWFVRASYTYSQTWGDYPGSISYNNSQVLPNLSTEYDVIELAPNHRGPLPLDRPHMAKLDGYYTIPVGDRTTITLGVGAIAESGVPELALGSHYLYGPNESILLPSGALGRTNSVTGVDLHVGIARHVRKSIAAEVFADVFNVFDAQPAATVDTTYTIANANPISGGSYSDLIWAKTIDANGNQTNTPVSRNSDFGKPLTRYAPTAAQLRFRLRF
jgi:hypothetical protein